MTAPEVQPDVLARLMGPEAREDPYPVYSWLRENAPVYPSAFGATLVSRFADVEYVLKNPELFPGVPEEAMAQMFPATAEHQSFEVLASSLVSSNPPKHTRLRHFIARDFTARRVTGLRPQIERIVDTLLDEVSERLAGGEAVDLHSMVSVPVPLQVIAELIGVPEEDQPRLATGVPQMMSAIDPAATPEAVTAADEAFAELGTYFDGLIAERRSAPQDDLVSALAAAQDDGDQLSDPELRTMLFTLWVAGFETTATAIDNAVLIMLLHPGQGHWLDSEEGTRAFVEEVLRFEPPVQVAPGIRFVARDASIGGHPVAAGTGLNLLIGAAQRDPDAYAEPDRFDPARTGPQPLSFGAGIHYCLGTGLSRLEIGVLLPRLRRRFPDLGLAGPPARRRSIPMRDFESLMVTRTGGA